MAKQLKRSPSKKTETAHESSSTHDSPTIIKIFRPDIQVSLIRSMSGVIGGAIFFGIFVLPIMFAAGGLYSLFVSGLFFLFFLFVSAVPAGFHLLNLNYTRYNIAEDGVHFYEGFFTRRQKFLPFKRVTDVNIVQHWPIDTWFGTGQIMLETAGIGSRLRLSNIRSPKKAYELLKEMTLKAK